MFHAVLSKPVTKLPVCVAPLLSVVPWLPIVAVPAFTVLVAVTVFTLRSLFKVTAIVESSPVCVIFVVIFVSPDIVTVEPSLFVLTSLLSASNFKPVLIKSVLVSSILLDNSVFVSLIFVVNSVLVSLILFVKSVFVKSNSVLEAMSLIVTVFVFAGVLPSCTVKSTLLPVTVYALSAAALFSTNR